MRDTQIINFLSQVFPNPFNGTNPIYGSTTSRGNLLRPFPQFIIAALPVEEPVGFSWYRAAGAHRFNTNAGFNRNSAQQLASNIRVSPVLFGGIRADGQARWTALSARSQTRTSRTLADVAQAEILNRGLPAVRHSGPCDQGHQSEQQQSGCGRFGRNRELSPYLSTAKGRIVDIRVALEAVQPCDQGGLC